MTASKCLFGLTFFIVIASTKHLYATVFFTEQFNYTNGQLTAHNAGADVSGGVWTTHSPNATQNPTPETIQVVDGEAEVRINWTEDASRSTGVSLTPGQTWYYGAKLTVNDLRVAPDDAAIGDNYFLHFKEDDATNFRGRLFLHGVTDPAKFTFGITSSSSSPTATAVSWAADLAFGTEYTVIVGYTADDDDTSEAFVRDGFTDLWINPVNAGSTFVTDAMPNENVSTDLSDPMVAVAIRQQNQAGSTQPQILIDALAAGDDFDEVLAALTGGATPTVDADFDDDELVDGADFLIWQRGLGVGAANSQGDADGDADVDAADLAAWRARFGTSGVAAGAVPEPSSSILFIIALTGLAAGRR